MEPFKNAFNLKLIEHMAQCFSNYDQNFDKKKFVEIASDNLNELELKARSNQIMEALQASLPKTLADSAPYILNTLAPIKNESDEVLFSQDFEAEHEVSGIQGWAIMPIADYIGSQAINEISSNQDKKDEIIAIAMMLFKEVTQRFSAEFGIRFLLNDYPDEVIKILTTWLTHPSQHVRRLISEGTRPRLPWSMQLPIFIEQPEHLLPLLNALKDDKEEYVRRSVANNLNDIAKDHPELVNKTIKPWLNKADKNRLRLIKHACRTLIKQGNKNTLTLLGYGAANLSEVTLSLSSEELLFGNSIELNLSLSADSKQDLIIDYVVHHQKANGSTSPKTFKWKVCKITSGKKLILTKKHTIKSITTRVYYPGKHQIDIVVNGEKKAQADFHLLMPQIT